MQISPKQIIVDFLRVFIEDPKHRNDTVKEQVFILQDVVDGIITINSNKSISHINYIELNNIKLKKWQDYIPIFKIGQVKLLKNIDINDVIKINYSVGDTNWIYDDKLAKNLSFNSFPRINLFIVSSTTERLGNTKAPVRTSITFQIDIWTKESSVFDYKNNKYSGDELGEVIGYEIQKAFEENEDYFFPILDELSIIQSIRDLPFNQEFQCFHKHLDINLKMLNIGRINGNN